MIHFLLEFFHRLTRPKLQSGAPTEIVAARAAPPPTQPPKSDYSIDLSMIIIGPRCVAPAATMWPKLIGSLALAIWPITAMIR